MSACHQHVGGDRQLPARRGGQQGAVVAGAGTAEGVGRGSSARIRANSDDWPPAISSPLDWPRLRRRAGRWQLVETPFIFQAVGAAEGFGQFDGFVDDDPVGVSGMVGQFEGADQEDAGFDRGKLGEGRSIWAPTWAASSSRWGQNAAQEAGAEILVGLVGSLPGRRDGLRWRLVVAADAPLVQALQGGPGPGGGPIWRAPWRRGSGPYRSSDGAFRRLAISPLPGRSRSPGCMRAMAWSSFSQVRMPLAMGTPVTSWTSMTARQASLDTTSKWPSLAADDRAQGDQGVVPAALGHGLRDQGISRAPGTVAMVTAESATPRRFNSGDAGREQAFADVLVEAAHADADPQAGTP